LEQTDLNKSNITIQELLESGAHFGHQRRRWNPKMKPYIYKELNGIYIIDLSKTIQQIRNAIAIVKDVVSQRKNILFVGTKKQAKDVVKELAEACGEFYVDERWLGGMLTNLTTIRKSIKKLEATEKKLASGTEGLTKKEVSLLSKEQEKLSKTLSGIRAMRKPPSLLVVVDPNKEHIAVAEAKKLGIPVMALVDTNCNPDPIDHVIACNDDALKSIKLVLQTIASAVHAVKSELPALASKKADPSNDFAEKDAQDEKKTAPKQGLKQKAQAHAGASTETKPKAK